MLRRAGEDTVPPWRGKPPVLLPSSDAVAYRLFTGGAPAFRVESRLARPVGVECDLWPGLWLPPDDDHRRGLDMVWWCERWSPSRKPGRKGEDMLGAWPVTEVLWAPERLCVPGGLEGDMDIMES